MAGTITLKLDATRNVKGEGEVTLREMLARVAKVCDKTPEELLSIGCAKVLATTQDAARRDSGKLASRLYSPALDKVADEKIPKPLVKAVETIDDVQAQRAAFVVRKGAAKK